MIDVINNSQGLQFDYELDFYDRRFLDCWRRQSVVFLEKAGAQVDLLFHNCLPSTDEIFSEHILNQKPKYAFPTPSVGDEGLALIGWRQRTQCYAQFKEALSDIKIHLTKVPFVVVMGSVFYLPHCPEHRSEHLNHSIVLVRPTGEDSWDVVDDDEASILKRYSYQERYIDDYFNNNGCRLIRYFEPVVGGSCDHALAVEKCADHVFAYTDTYRMFSDIEAIVCAPYESMAVKTRKLHEAFSIFSGSRSLFSRFVKSVLGDLSSAAVLEVIARESMVIKYTMAKASVTGRINMKTLVVRCEKLIALEQQAINSLKLKMVTPSYACAK
ncbi:hypothetical protein [Pseudomonas graminis]|uniref:Butirosin biosynthesis protein H N-terminal domain-containing protein n=1 Tax=Pseudomonas graminis TaxID=158627 RepID=A0A1C2EEY7_9PSED|nr:hypothetical protein [Pseudomonas graminis]OCX25520.1 hypothetical protein BBI10_02210 [Pseudomonas graminis]